ITSLDSPDSGAISYPRGCVIRNCVVDCNYEANPVSISGITYSGTTATVTTRVPHGRAANDWVRIAGAFVNGAADNPFNGSFRISNVNSTGFQYTMTSVPAGLPVGDLWLDHFPSHIVKISNISAISDPLNPNLYEITTYSAHYRIPGGLVSI